eukprot:8261268-Pyramimonas_sp.AAC.1
MHNSNCRLLPGSFYRVSSTQEHTGLDRSYHGRTAYYDLYGGNHGKNGNDNDDNINIPESSSGGIPVSSMGGIHGDVIEGRVHGDVTYLRTKKGCSIAMESGPEPGICYNSESARVTGLVLAGSWPRPKSSLPPNDQISFAPE